MFHSKLKKKMTKSRLNLRNMVAIAICLAGFSATNVLAQKTNIGDIISFGKYEWRVLDVQGDKALIITKDCISLMKIEFSSHPGYANFPYSGSNIRTYVDIELRKSFSDEEQSRIISTTISEHGSTLYEHIFLLSVNEAKKYFKNDNDRLAYYNGENVCWWLRTNGTSEFATTIAYVHRLAHPYPVQGFANGGAINDYGVSQDWDYAFGIRPALWLKLEKSTK
jgi:hypothetical protein